MKHVFISYKRDDGDFAARLKDKIDAAGFATWMDLGLTAGQDWGDEIDQAIRESLALVVVMTPEAKASDYITYEWSFAFGVGVKVVPVLLKPTKLHPRLERLHYLDFINLTVRPWDDLIRAIQGNVSEINTSTSHGPQEVPVFIRKAISSLNDINPVERHNAVETLSQAKHPAAQETLIAALQHPLKDVRIRAAIAVAEFQDERAMHSLVEGIKDTDPQTREVARNALLKLIAYLAGPSIGDIWSNPNNTLRTKASIWLGKFRHQTQKEPSPNTETKTEKDDTANQDVKMPQSNTTKE